LEQIQTGDSIFFDASSTVFHVALLLPNIEVTVLTSALKVAVELARRPAVRVILTGGIVGHGSLSCQGGLAETILERCHVQKAFLSCRGVDAVRGLSEPNAEQADLKREIIGLADQTILLADHSKAGLKSSYFFAKLTDVDIFIGDRNPGDAVTMAVKKGGGKIILPKEQIE